MAAAAPRTPSKKAGSDDFINSLSNQYNLRIVVAGLAQSPRRRMEQITTDEGRIVELIHQRLRCLFFCGREVLDGTVAKFHTCAETICKTRMLEPSTGQDTLPVMKAPTRARTGTERRELQNQLLKLLDEAVAKVLGRSDCGGLEHASLEPASPLQVPRLLWSKRTSREFQDGSLAKRSKGLKVGDLGLGGLFGHLNEVPIRTRSESSSFSTTAAAHTASETKSSPAINKSLSIDQCDATANISRKSLASTVFSQPQNDKLVANTQTTVEAGSQERKLAQTSSPSGSVDAWTANEPFSRQEVPAACGMTSSDTEDVESGGQYDASPGVIQALHESFPDQATRSELVRNHIAPLPVTERGHVLDNIYDAAKTGGVGCPSTTSSLFLTVNPVTLKDRMKHVWPAYPAFLNQAPLAIAWEVTRISKHCGINIEDLDLLYDPAWTDQAKLRTALQRHPHFKGKTFPERCRSETWAASLTTFQSRGLAVSLSLDVQFSKNEKGPLFDVSLQPLNLELGHRLTRRFGSDRFLEVNFPSPTGRSHHPPSLRSDDNAAEMIIRWLVEEKHFILGRQWAPFFTRDSKKLTKHNRWEEAKLVPIERVYFFAEDGHSFRPPNLSGLLPNKGEAVELTERTKVQLPTLLEWAFQTQSNMTQPALKLFSRLALSLSRTHATVVLRPDQIRQKTHDIRSPIGNNMNDGIGQMSNSLARKIGELLGLTDTPSGFQGRIGSAKGFWIRDVSCLDDEDWIVIYPSQRKWECSFADEDHRTFEVKMPARQLKSASLNLQFIPVIENRAKDPKLMRTTIANRLLKSLEDELERQRSAMEHPTQFRQWAYSNSSHRSDRIVHGHVPFLAGLPESDDETLNFLLDGGFNPKEQKVLQDLAWDLRFRKCETLKSKLNIKVGRSAYAYMVVDFLGVLEEGEVHLGFSSKFQNEEFSDTLLHGVDVLVARAPAHLVSDVQRVRAVFRPELRGLKDVVVFSTKGNVALAHKLSGGDYDGDQAWVCWDPDIVNNFQNADVPVFPDLFKTKYLQKQTRTFQDLIRKAGGRKDVAVTDFIYESFSFNMQPQFLGLCTNYKLRLCYKNGTVNDEAAILLSTLVGYLVDQAKQGIIFTEEQWDRLRRERIAEPFHLDEPAYMKDRFLSASPPSHILDYLKFSIAKPTIENALAAFHKSIQGTGAANFWDRDLAAQYNDFQMHSQTSETFKIVLDSLIADIQVVEQKWKLSMAGLDSEHPGEVYPLKVRAVYEEWLAIKPPASVLKSKTVMTYLESYLPDSELSMWARLKASTAFKLCYRRSSRFVWRMAGRQLQWMKAMHSAQAAGNAGALAIVPHVYNILKPDSGIVTALAAKGDAAGYAESAAEEVDFDEHGMQLDDV